MKFGEVKDKLIEFVSPYYASRDIMHNMQHIELVSKSVDVILGLVNYAVNLDFIRYATYFHGVVLDNEQDVKAWLEKQGLLETDINIIIQIALESQRYATPKTIEGKILHDAHIIEGGKAYAITKCLTTGALRGQTLNETVAIMETIFAKSKCYLPEVVPLFKEYNAFAKEFVADLKLGTQ